MRTDQLEVHVDVPGGPVRAGTAYFTRGRTALSTTFTYDPEYFAILHSVPVDPGLPLVSGGQHVPGLPGALGDGAPDRWGRNLIDKRERSLARQERRAARRLDEVDYLLGVSDHTRQGALRYRQDGPFLADHVDVPRLLSLPRLLRAADHAVADPDDAAAVKALLDAGTGSLGGARPKAAVTLDDGSLGLAKFPHVHDRWDVMAWEATVLDLAGRAGIAVPDHELTRVDDRHVLLLRRFDRGPDDRRYGYMSAMTVVGARDGEDRDYDDVAGALADVSASLRADRAELFDRVVLSVAVHNTDDHLRNLGVLDVGKGWRLAPLFDVNPDPDVLLERRTTIHGAASPFDEADGLRALAETCGLRRDQVEQRVRAVVDAVGSWRDVARANAVPERELRTVGAAFESGLDVLGRVLAAV